MKFAAAFAGQVICVAGAGGYIGSALVKALAPAGVGCIVLLDSSEYGLFEIHRWTRSEYPDVSCEPVLGSVGDELLLNEMFSRFHPRVVFHAAAFKHVGMLEGNPFAAIANNALGTYTFAKAALRHGVSKFVLVSTDKAANPHSVMGASKRLAELFTLSLDGMNAIRLGNVLGSPGSVVPLFLEQIEKSLTISVTHADASRYFLSRDDAVTAILAAGLVEIEGYILLPNLPDPVRIVDLAKSVASSATVPVCFTGLRPGEKLNEDLIGSGESRIGTVEGSLTIVQTTRLSRRQAEDAAQQLRACVANRDSNRLLELLCSLLPEYVPSRLMLESSAVVS